MISTLNKDELSNLQGDVDSIRNVCIVAHVDHGKTTITDCLISTNGFIASPSVGKSRYLDSIPYEQQHGITIKSSCISLIHEHRTSPSPSTYLPNAVSDPLVLSRRYLINLIDSPGHMDFSSEVSSALRMSDGCFVVVDVIEGICIQTRAVLRQAWQERLRATLVFNKMDKFWTHLKLSLEEIYQRIAKMIDQVNQIVLELRREQELIDDQRAWKECTKNDPNPSVMDDDAMRWMPSHKGQDSSFFDPRKSNVIFCSAHHRWGFVLDQFVDIWMPRLNTNRNALKQALWGEYYYNQKTKEIVTMRPHPQVQVMFVQLVLSILDGIYTIIKDLSLKYELNHQSKIQPTSTSNGWSTSNTSIEVSGTSKPRVHTQEALTSIVNKLHAMAKRLQFTFAIQPSDRQPTEIMISFFHQWISISHVLLGTAVRLLPNPREAQRRRLSAFWQPSCHDLTPHGQQLQTHFQSCLQSCMQDQHAPIIAYVSKVFSIPNVTYHHGVSKGEPAEHSLIAMTRLFSGTLHVGQSVYLLGPRYNPSFPDQYVVKVKVPQLYLLMGPRLQAVDQVKAGNVFGIGARGAGGIGSYVARKTRKSREIDKEDKNSSGWNQEDSAKLHGNDQVQDLSNTHVDPKLSTNFVHPNIHSSAQTMIDEDSDKFVSHIIKTATITSHLDCPVFGILSKAYNAIFRVAIEPRNAHDLDRLESGLSLLYHADPAVEIQIMENGEHILGAVGELHLQRCIQLLEEEYAQIPIKVSPPIVSFCETILSQPYHCPNSIQDQLLAMTETNPSYTKSKLSSIVSQQESRWMPFCQNWLVHESNSSSVNHGYSMIFTSMDDNNSALVAQSSDQLMQITMRAIPIPEEILFWLETHRVKTRRVNNILRTRALACAQKTSNLDPIQCPSSPSQLDHSILAMENELLSNWSESFRSVLKQAPGQWLQQAPYIWDIGPHGSNTNIILNNIPKYATSRRWKGILQLTEMESKRGKEIQNVQPESDTIENWFALLSHLDETIRSAFQLATKSGPLCEEPLMGVAFQVLNIQFSNFSNLPPPASPHHRLIPPAPCSPSQVDFSFDQLLESTYPFSLEVPENHTSDESSQTTKSSPRPCAPPSSLSDYAKFQATCFSLLKQLFRQCCLMRHQRLVEAFFSVQIHVLAEHMGSVYAVINRRRGQVILDEINEGSSIALIDAYLPSAEALGFSEELVSKTAGSASAQLTLSHWKVLEIDPYFVPKTQDELEEHGQNLGGMTPNLARKYLLNVRKRKGLAVPEKMVEFANKQRTRSKKK